MKREETNETTNSAYQPHDWVLWYDHDPRCTECHLGHRHTWAEHDASIDRFLPIEGDGRGD